MSDTDAPPPDGAEDAAPVAARTGVASWLRTLRFHEVRGRLAQWLRRFHFHDPHRTLGQFVFATTVAHTLFFTLLLLFIDCFSPFGLEQADRQQAAQVMQRLLAPMHPWIEGYGRKLIPGASAPDSPSGQTPGQKAVTVVTIDRAYFSDQHVGSSGKPVWPLPVYNLFGIISQVASARPRAIFLDLVFPIAPRELTAGKSADRDEVLIQLANRLRAIRPAVPILIGEAIDLPEGAINAQCGATPYVDLTELAGTQVTARTFRAALAGAPNIHFVAVSQMALDEGDYALGPVRVGQPGGCQLSSGANSAYLASPALALAKLYADGCPHNHVAADDACADTRFTALMKEVVIRPGAGELMAYSIPNATSPSKDKLTGSLTTLWGSNLGPELKRTVRAGTGGDACIDEFNAPWLDIGRMIGRGLAGHDEATVQTHRCVYIDNLSAGQAGQGLRFDDGTPPALNLDRAFLTNRLVIIGADVPQARDYQLSPVNGTVAGAFIHAVAVENLLSMGSDFHWRQDDAPFVAQLVALALAVALRVATAVNSRTSCPWEQRRGRVWWLGLRLLLGAAVGILLAVMLGLYMFVRYDISLADLAGPVLLVALSAIEAMQEAFRDVLSEMVASWAEARKRWRSASPGSTHKAA